jgi:hypothetical protein
VGTGSREENASEQKNLIAGSHPKGENASERKNLIAGSHPKKGTASTGGPARYKTPVEAARVDRRIERYSFSREHPVRF